MFLEPYVKIIMLQKTCSLCGSKFDCTENETCWCFKETRIIENEIKYDECICKDAFHNNTEKNYWEFTAYSQDPNFINKLFRN